ncbi:MAG: hypothetical protein IJT25_00875 [Clostridia bacterium]|nr:hypothetical protein [Clostridia bacterium]
MTYYNNTLTFKKSKTKHEFIKILLTYIFSFIVFGAIILLITNPTKYTLSITSGFLLFANCVFPGLFPFLILTKLLTSLNVIDKLSLKLSKITQKLFKVSGVASFVFIISCLCGYPMGARVTEDLLNGKKINNEEAPYIFLLSSVSGPMFIIGAIGSGMLKNHIAGVLIYFAHIISAIICALIFCNNRKRRKQLLNLKLQNKNNKPSLSGSEISYDKLLGNSIYSSIETIIVVGAYITIFFMLIDMLIGTKILSPITFIFAKLFSTFSINPNFATAISSGLVEMTRGASELSNFGTNPIIVSLICFLVSFSGLSIIAQSLALAKNSKPSFLKFILYKLCHACLSFILCLILCKIFL